MTVEFDLGPRLSVDADKRVFENVCRQRSRLSLVAEHRAGTSLD